MASGRIKGITIEIGGDSTKLQKALGDVDKSLRTTQGNLKDINKLLKLNPGNTELLTQKQKNLEKAIGDTKSRLNELKSAQNQVKEGTDDWDALQREIIATQNDLDKLEREYKDFGSVAKQQLKAVGNKTKEVGDKMKGVGEGMTKNVTAPIAAVGAASLVAFKSVDEGYDTIIKKTGATGEAAQALRASMESIATTIPTDFATAGEAIGEVNTRFGLTGEELEDLSTKFIQFAQLNDTDVTSSVDSVQKALEAYGLSASDAGAYLDMLNATGQRTGISVDSLSAGAVKNAAAFKEMGLTLDQATEFMGDLEISGADSELVLSGLRKALKNSAKDGKSFDQALAELQDEVSGSADGMDGLAAAYELFGGAGAQVYEAVKNGTLNFKTLGTTVTEAGGNIESTFNETLDPMDKFQTTLNELKLVGAELGGTLLEVLTPVIEKVAEIIGTIKEKWDALSPGTQEAIVKIALVAAAIGPVLVVLGTLISSIGAIMGVLGGVVGVLGGPLLLAIGGAIAAGVLIWKNWDKIKEAAGKLKDKIVEVWGKIKSKVTEVATNIKNTVTEKFSALKESVSEKFSSLKQNIANRWEEMKNNTQIVTSAIKEAVSEKFTNIKNAISEKMSAAKQNLSEKWTNMKNTVSEKATAMKDAVSEKFGSIKDKISEKLGSAKDTVSEKLGAIKDAFSEKFESAKEIVSSAIEKIKGFFNFSWSLPSLKMPHFSITGGFSLNPPSIPHISVEWYKKAYDQPYLFTTPTVVDGRGFGDGGRSGEIVYGKDSLMKDIAAASGGDQITINVYAREGMNINRLADEIQNRLAFVQKQRNSVYA